MNRMDKGRNSPGRPEISATFTFASSQANGTKGPNNGAGHLPGNPMRPPTTL